MSWVAAAVLGSAAIGAAVQSDNASKARKAQVGAANDQIGYARESRDLALRLQEPFRQGGLAATAALMDLTGLSRGEAPKPLSFEEWAAQQPGTAPVRKKKKGGLFGGGALGALLAPSPKNFLKGQYDPAGAIKSAINGETVTVTPELQGNYQKYLEEFKATPSLASYPKYEFTADPGYEFRLGEGNKALEHSLVARGGALSGAAAKSALRYAQNYASNEYANVYNRIATIAGFGPMATNASQNAITMANNTMSNALTNAGDARASSYIAQGNIWSNAINQAAFGIGAFGNQSLRLGG